MPEELTHVHDDWLYEVGLSNNECLVTTLVVGSDELNHVLQKVQCETKFCITSVRCLENYLRIFLHDCFAMNAVIED